MTPENIKVENATIALSLKKRLGAISSSHWTPVVHQASFDRLNSLAEEQK